MLFGLATRFGMMNAQMKSFMDGTGGLWGSGALVGKPAGCFVSVGTQGGGMETTALTFVTQCTHHGMVFVVRASLDTIWFPCCPRCAQSHGSRESRSELLTASSGHSVHDSREAVVSHRYTLSAVSASCDTKRLSPHRVVFVGCGVGVRKVTMRACPGVCMHGPQPLGYSFGGEMFSNDSVHGGSPWGAGTFAGADGSRQPSDYELELARHQGKTFAATTLKLAA